MFFAISGLPLNGLGILLSPGDHICDMTFARDVFVVICHDHVGPSSFLRIFWLFLPDHLLFCLPLI